MFVCQPAQIPIKQRTWRLMLTMTVVESHVVLNISQQVGPLEGVHLATWPNNIRKVTMDLRRPSKDSCKYTF